MNPSKYWVHVFAIITIALLVLMSACSSAPPPAEPAAEEPESAEIVEEEAVEESKSVTEEEITEVEVKETEAEEAMAEEPESIASEDYVAEIRPASQPWKIGYGDGLSGIPFTDSVTDSINEVAEQMGVEVVYCDNAYDQEKTVECANLLVTQEVDAVVFANWIAGTEDLVAGIFTEAGLPCVAYDGPHPGCAAFGPDNFIAGKEAGKFLGQYALDQGWDPAETELVLIWSPDVPVHKARADGATEGVREVFDVPDENIHDVPTETFEDVFANVTTWTTGNPDAKHVLCFGHSDQPGVDCALALEQAGLIGNAAAASLGASDEALVDLRTRSDDESIFKATISFFPERYGQYLIPALVDMLEGKPVPDEIIPAVSPVTRDNVNDLYPE